MTTSTFDLAEGDVELLHPRDAMDLVAQATAAQRFPPYWAEPWPSGIELARVVSAAAVRGTRVLELGCGLGLPSIAAACAGAQVLAVDRSGDALDFVAANARRNRVAVETEQCRWEDPGLLLEREPWDLVLAADVLYDAAHRRPLLELLPRLVPPSGRVWLTDPGRPPLPGFLRAAAREWSVRSVGTRHEDVRLHELSHPAREPGPGAQPSILRRT